MHRACTKQHGISCGDGEKQSSDDTKDNKGVPQAILNMTSQEAQELRTKCMEQASLSYCKTAELIQHIVPVKPPNAKDDSQVEPVLHLTKKELKRALYVKKP